MWNRSDFFADRGKVDRFLCSREFACVRLAETIERTRAFPSHTFDILGFVHYAAKDTIDGAVVVERDGTIHCVLPVDEKDDASLFELIRFIFPIKKVSGPPCDILRIMRGINAPHWFTQSYHLMRLGNNRISESPIVSKIGSPGYRRLEIRDATEDDLDALISLHREYEREELHLNLSRQETEFRIRTLQAHQLILIACLGGAAVGKINTNARGIFCDQIGGFYVAAAHRAHGIGTALLHQLLMRIRDADKDAVLYVRRENKPARRIYERAGFLRVGEYGMSTVSPTH